MTNKLAKYSSPRHLLNRILEQPGLVSIVQQLDAKVLVKLVDHVGLEDSGEIIALATTDQIKKVFDLDLWRNEKPGKEEKFDPDRFGLWLEILLETGARFAAEKIADLDEDFLVMAIAQHVLVLNIDELATAMSSGYNRSRTDDDLLEKALESGLNQEFEEFRVISKNHQSWDSILTLLVELDSEHHELLRTILERCNFISTEYIDDNGGLYQVLTTDEQIQGDVAFEREQRREKEGYVSPSAATSFLSLIRISKLEDLFAGTAYDTVTQSYFKNIETVKSEVSTDNVEFVEMLKDAGVVSPSQSRLLLNAPQAHEGQGGLGTEKYPLIRSALAGCSSDPVLHAKSMSELNYLANVLVSGCSFSDRAFRPGEAAEAALATCNLGLEAFLAQTDAPSSSDVLKYHDVTKMFRIGWWILCHQVAGNSARSLLLVLSSVRVTDDWLNKELARLVKALENALQKGTPWQVRDQLDFLESIYDQTTVRSLGQLLSECPTLQLGPSEMQFISNRQQIGQVQGFVQALSKAQT